MISYVYKVLLCIVYIYKKKLISMYLYVFYVGVVSYFIC